MLIYIENSFGDHNILKGKSLFCYRLAQALMAKGIDVTDNPEYDVDVSLNVIRIKHTKAKVKLLRLDGVWHDTGKNYLQKNESIKKDLNNADGVVYQSKYARQMCDRYLGKPKVPGKVIYNGTDVSYYEKVKPAMCNEKNVFMAFSKWRPHKRLNDAIESFLLADIKDSILIVAGNVENSGVDSKILDGYFSLPQIKYIGNASQDVLASFLKIAKASIHLCWFDACPNSVIEALAAGVPVICNNTGGTKELIDLCGGYICHVDKPYDMKPVDLYHPPKIKRRLVANALIDSVQNEARIKNEPIKIEYVADNYISFMKELL